MRLLRLADPAGSHQRAKAKDIQKQGTHSNACMYNIATWQHNHVLFTGHIDGYDKLSPFGLTIHGCIDG